MIEAETASNARSRRSNFGGNWINGLDGAGWSQRRRLMAVLRRAHRVLGLKRDRLGLGSLGGGMAGAVLAVGIIVPQAAFGQTVVGNGVSTNTANCTNPSAGNQSVAVGCGSNVAGSASTAVGNNADVNGDNAVAIGTSATATGNASIAIGYAMGVNGLNAIGIGVFASATGTNALAVGGNAHANADGASALAWA